MSFLQHIVAQIDYICQLAGGAPSAWALTSMAALACVCPRRHRHHRRFAKAGPSWPKGYSNQISLPSWGNWQHIASSLPGGL
jgi:hypothetical protein